MRKHPFNITKNNVSYFFAGIRAALILTGKTKEEVDDLFYKSVDTHNLALKSLWDYDEEKYDEQGIELMESRIVERGVKI